jgi:lactate permease
VLAGILVLSRTVPAFKHALTVVAWSTEHPRRDRASAATFQPLYLPGGILVFVCLVTVFLHKMNWALLRQGGEGIQRHAAGRRLRAGVHRADGAHHDPVGRERERAQEHADRDGAWVAASVGDIYPLFAPTVGALGAFLAGSNTVSNLMLSQYQYSVAQALGVSGATMVAAQSVGAAAGNMIAIHNVVAASATVGVMGREGLTCGARSSRPSTTWCWPAR